MAVLSLKGRASRGAFAACLWVWGAVYVWLAALTVAAAGLGEELPTPVAVLHSIRVSQGVAAAMMLMLVLATPLLLIGIIAPLVRRLHDLNLPGLLVLVFVALTWLSPYPDEPRWMSLLPPPGTLLWILLMLLIPGTAGDNRYGPVD